MMTICYKEIFINSWLRWHFKYSFSDNSPLLRLSAGYWSDLITHTRKHSQIVGQRSKQTSVLVLLESISCSHLILSHFPVISTTLLLFLIVFFYPEALVITDDKSYYLLYPLLSSHHLHKKKKKLKRLVHKENLTDMNCCLLESRRRNVSQNTSKLLLITNQ